MNIPSILEEQRRALLYHLYDEKKLPDPKIKYHELSPEEQKKHRKARYNSMSLEEKSEYIRARKKWVDREGVDKLD